MKFVELLLELETCQAQKGSRNTSAELSFLRLVALRRRPMVGHMRGNSATYAHPISHELLPVLDPISLALCLSLHGLALGLILTVVSAFTFILSASSLGTTA
jgi:hypothetical protein